MIKRRDFISSGLALTALTLSGRQSIADDADQRTKQSIMNYTVLSSGATMRAWNDSDFRNELLEDPNRVIRNFWGDQASHIKLVIHENGNRLKHFPLPYRSDFVNALPKDKLLEILLEETAGETSLEYFLPAVVTANALLNSSYRERLLRSPNSTLAEAGYRTDTTIIIHANDEATHHLALHVNPINIVQLVQMDKKVEDLVAQSSGQCCASGTCDISCAKGCHGPTMPFGQKNEEQPHGLPQLDRQIPNEELQRLKSYMHGKII